MIKKGVEYCSKQIKNNCWVESNNEIKENEGALAELNSIRQYTESKINVYLDYKASILIKNEIHNKYMRLNLTAKTTKAQIYSRDMFARILCGVEIKLNFRQIESRVIWRKIKLEI